MAVDLASQRSSARHHKSFKLATDPEFSRQSIAEFDCVAERFGRLISHLSTWDYWTNDNLQFWNTNNDGECNSAGITNGAHFAGSSKFSRCTSERLSELPSIHTSWHIDAASAKHRIRVWTRGNRSSARNQSLSIVQC